LVDFMAFSSLNEVLCATKHRQRVDFIGFGACCEHIIKVILIYLGGCCTYQASLILPQ
jgi:hypothetical protein